MYGPADEAEEEGAGPEQRVAAHTPGIRDTYVTQTGPEQRLAAHTPVQRRCLTVTEVSHSNRGVSPEQRLAAHTPVQW